MNYSFSSFMAIAAPIPDSNRLLKAFQPLILSPQAIRYEEEAKRIAAEEAAAEVQGP